MFRGGSSHIFLAIHQSWCLDYSPVHNISFTALEKNIVTARTCAKYPSECTQLYSRKSAKNTTGWTFFFDGVFRCGSGWSYGNFLRWVLFVVGMARRKNNQHPICQDGFWLMMFSILSFFSSFFVGGRSGKTKRLRFFFHNHFILFRELSNHFHMFIVFLETLERIFSAWTWSNYSEDLGSSLHGAVLTSPGGGANLAMSFDYRERMHLDSDLHASDISGAIGCIPFPSRTSLLVEPFERKFNDDHLFMHCKRFTPEGFGRDFLLPRFCASSIWQFFGRSGYPMGCYGHFASYRKSNLVEGRRIFGTGG